MTQYDIWLNMTGLGDICHAFVVAKVMQGRVSIKLVGEEVFKDLAAIVCPEIPYQITTDNVPIHRRTWLDSQTTLAFHITDYCMMTMVDRQAYPGELDFPNVVTAERKKNRILIAPYSTSPVREMNADVFNSVKAWCDNCGIELVIIGCGKRIKDRDQMLVSYIPSECKTEGVKRAGEIPYQELLELMASSLAVVGIDNGLLHLASLTDVPIISGFTTVSPIRRLPYKDGILGKNVKVCIPHGECFFCQEWLHDPTHQHRSCYYGHRSCCADMRGEDFVLALNDTIINMGKKDGKKGGIKTVRKGRYFDCNSFTDRVLWRGNKPSVQAP